MELLEREWEHDQLVDLLEQARAGHGRVALITGEPGIGKTSLVRSFLGSHAGTVRVLMGQCDNLTTPRPHGPFLDMAMAGATSIGAALEANADSAEVYRGVVAELSTGGPATVLVLEDIHWADEASLDLLTSLLRRVDSLSALVIATHRDLDHHSPVLQSVGEIDPAVTVRIALAPLSAAAVSTMAGEELDKTHALYAATAGNPFFVTELLSARDEGIPATVADAVVARLNSLQPETRGLLELMSVVPGRVGYDLLDLCMPEYPDACAQAQQRGIVEATDDALRFRHALVRETIQQSLSASRHRSLHRLVLAHLPTVGAHVARIVHHAEGAGATDVLVEQGPIAARGAASAQAHREAISHFERVLRHEKDLERRVRATLCDELAYEYWADSQPVRAAAVVEQAISTWEELDDPVALGASLQSAANLLTWASRPIEGARARQRSLEVLEPLGPTAALTRLYDDLILDAMGDLRIADAERFAGLGLAAGRAMPDRDGPDPTLSMAGLLAYWARGDSSALDNLINTAPRDHVEAIMVAACNRAWASVERNDPRAVDDLAWAREWVTRHDMTAGYAHVLVHQARWAAEHGDWQAADAHLVEAADMVNVSEVGPYVSVPYYGVAGLLAIRRGESGAAAELQRHVEGPTVDLGQRLPLVALLAEAAWLSGDSTGAADALESVRRVTTDLALPGASEIAFWMWRAGIWTHEVPEGDHPRLLSMRGEWLAAAKQWQQRGRGYEAAEALAETATESNLLTAIETLDTLGAKPLAKRVRDGLRELGVVHVPRGQQQRTRENPAGLTARQLDVLVHLQGGATNTEIAEMLFLSVRTVETHVGAILQKLGVSTRREAVLKANELGISHHAGPTAS